jgi:hypothetical protein
MPTLTPMPTPDAGAYDAHGCRAADANLPAGVIYTGRECQRKRNPAYAQGFISICCRETLSQREQIRSKGLSPHPYSAFDKGCAQSGNGCSALK